MLIREYLRDDKILLDENGMIVRQVNNHKKLDSKGRENRQPEFDSIYLQ